MFIYFVLFFFFYHYCAKYWNCLKLLTKTHFFNNVYINSSFITFYSIFFSPVGCIQWRKKKLDEATEQKESKKTHFTISPYSFISFLTSQLCEALYLRFNYSLWSVLNGVSLQSQKVVVVFSSACNKKAWNKNHGKKMSVMSCFSRVYFKWNIPRGNNLSFDLNKCIKNHQKRCNYVLGCLNRV